MDNAIVVGATAVAVVLALGAILTLGMKRYVLSGTLFMFTAFAIYIRETRG